MRNKVFSVSFSSCPLSLSYFSLFLSISDLYYVKTLAELHLHPLDGTIVKIEVPSV